MTPTVNYWEDSQLRGSATDHKFIPAQREDHACAICGMQHKVYKRLTIKKVKVKE